MTGTVVPIARRAGGESQVASRWAIYWAPPRDGVLWRLGCQWLGRDPERDVAFAPSPLAGLDTIDAAALTADPRRYGLHATLKPPFRLRDGLAPDDVHAACAEFARTHAPVAIGRLRVEAVSDFVALVPVEPNEALDAFAFACVEAFDPMRAPLSAEERARRLHTAMSARERALFETWGYPYVNDAFRFHVTLTNALAPGLRSRVVDGLRERFAVATTREERLDEIALYHEPRAGAPFRLEARYRLAG